MVISFLLALFYSIYLYFKDGYWENVFPISWDIFVGIMSAISESSGSGKFGGGGSSGRGGFSWWRSWKKFLKTIDKPL